MNKARKTIEQLKAEFRSKLEKHTADFKKAIIRELEFQWRNYKQTHPEVDLMEFEKELMKKFQIPAMQKLVIKMDLEKTQKQIAAVWDDYFNGIAKKDQKIISVDYEKMLSAYQVDFLEINKEIRDTTIREVRRAARADYGFGAIRNNLIISGIGTGEAYTQANTAVSQFDNSMMFEFADQAGIKKFRYGGILNPDSRIFCRKHIHKIYTLKEINEMDNGQGLPVQTSCGGYNCTHYWEAESNLKL